MNKKKSKKFDVERKRGLFFWIGLNISLLLVISAFEWRSEFDTEIMKYNYTFDPTDELIPIIEFEKPKPPKPKLIAPVVTEAKDEDIIDPPDITFDPDDLAILDDIEPSADIDDEDIDKVWTGVIESMPKPREGYKQFYAFVGKNMKYPKKAQRMGIEGKVFVQFVIDKQGNITELEVIRGIGMGCDEEALRVMRLLPPWKPGKQRGKPVLVRMVLPLTFKLSR